MSGRLVFAASMLVLSASALADDLAVPKQYRTIDDALAAAKAGDRVLVTGGTYTDLTIDTPGVTLVGRRATLKGKTTIAAEGVTVRGFKLARRSRIEAWADRATLEGNSFSPAGLYVAGNSAVLRGNRAPITSNFGVAGDDALVEDNRGAWVTVTGDRAEVRGNQALGFDIDGDDARIHDDVAVRLIEVHGARDEVRGNRASRAGIVVYGDDAVVTSNVVREAAAGVGVEGDRALVEKNDLVVDVASYPAQCWSSLAGGVTAVYVQGASPTLADNRIVHRGGRGVVLAVDGASVRDNELIGVSSASSLTLTGTGNVVTGNTVTQSGSERNGGVGILVDGDANVLRSNDVSGTASDGVVIGGGAGNVVADTTVTGARGCGVLVSADASRTSIDGLASSGGDAAFVNAGAGTTLTGSTFSGGKFADVVDVASMRVLDGNSLGAVSHDSLLVPATPTPNAVVVGH